MRGCNDIHMLNGQICIKNDHIPCELLHFTYIAFTCTVVRLVWFQSICSGVTVEEDIMARLSPETKTQPARNQTDDLTITGSACYTVTQLGDLYYFLNSFKVKHCLFTHIVCAFYHMNEPSDRWKAFPTYKLFVSERFTAVKHAAEVCRISFLRNITGVIGSFYL